MVKINIKSENIDKFLNAWDKEIYNLNIELKPNIGCEKINASKIYDLTKTQKF